MTRQSYPVRPEVQDFESYSPGLTIDEIRVRFGLDTVIKMASNENPLGTSPLVAQRIAARAGLAFRYAQTGNPRLVEALAAHHGLDGGHFVTGNGSDEIIDLLIRICPTPDRHNVVASKPSFSMYGIQSRLCGVEFRQTPLRTDFSFDWPGLLAAVDERTALVFLTTPDNPSGYCPPAAEVESFARALPPTCLLVVDEAYMDFCTDEGAHSLLARLTEFPHLAILRTFSKSFGLAGLRLGYGILPLPLAAHMRNARPPFSVNILAEEAGLAALEDETFRKKTLRTVAEGRAYLTGALAKLGCRVFPSQANFLMFQLPAGHPKGARAVFEALLARGVIIRPLSSYGLPEHLRVSMGTVEENSCFITLLREVLA